MSETTLRAYSNESLDTESTEDSRVSSRASTCPECGGQLESNADRTETVCAQCGLVVDEAEVDPSPEWRAFTPEERDEKSRVGAPTTNLMHDKGLSSVIDWQDKDAHGNALSSRHRRKMQRLRTWDERFRTRDHKERNLKQALAEIERMGSALGLPKDVRETASVIYRRELDEDLLPGRSIEGVATAAIYAAARQMNRPRSIDEVATVSRIGEMEFKRTYRYINREIGLAVEPADPLRFVDRIVDDLKWETKPAITPANSSTRRKGRACSTGRARSGWPQQRSTPPGNSPAKSPHRRRSVS